MSATITVSFKQTEGPGYLSHFELTRDGDNIVLQSVNRKGYAQMESVIDAKAFFEALEKLK